MSNTPQDVCCAFPNNRIIGVWSVCCYSQTPVKHLSLMLGTSEFKSRPVPLTATHCQELKAYFPVEGLAMGNSSMGIDEGQRSNTKWALTDWQHDPFTGTSLFITVTCLFIFHNGAAIPQCVFSKSKQVLPFEMNKCLGVFTSCLIAGRCYSTCTVDWWSWTTKCVSHGKLKLFLKLTL